MYSANAYTVIIPAWNAAENITAALHSIWQQTIQPAEIILVDDGSTDNTVEIALASEVPIRVHSQQNSGPGSATTAGIALVTTPLLATLDSDDLWLPDKMECQIDVINRTTACAAVFGHYQNFSGSTDNHIGSSKAGWGRTTMLIKTDKAVKLGPIIDQPSMVGEMIDWLARAREYGYQLEMLQKTVALRRLRSGSLSDPKRLTRNQGYLAVAREALRRRKMGIKE